MSLADEARPAMVVAVTAKVAPDAIIGEGCRIWDDAQVREGAEIGASTTIGRNAYIDRDVRIGANCKIQNNALIYWPAVIGGGVFIGPGVILTNDRHPRAVLPDGRLRGSDDWTPVGVTVDRGASIGAGAVILGGVDIGRWAMVGAGAVVTRDVAPHSLVAGNPAIHVGWIGRSGGRLVEDEDGFVDPVTGDRFREVDGRVEESR